MSTEFINIRLWKSSTKNIYIGVLLYYLCDILVDILGLVNSANSLASFMGGGSSNGSGDIFEYIVKGAVFVGAVLIFVGLGKFKNAVDKADKANVNKLYNALILLFIGSIVDFIPLLGWIAGIMNIIAMILMLTSFSILKKSQTFPTLAKKGASQLHTAMVLSIIAIVVGWIPLIGVIAIVFSIIALIFIISGWNNINSQENINEIRKQKLNDPKKLHEAYNKAIETTEEEVNLLLSDSTTLDPIYVDALRYLRICSSFESVPTYEGFLLTFEPNYIELEAPVEKKERIKVRNTVLGILIPIIIITLLLAILIPSYLAKTGSKSVRIGHILIAANNVGSGDYYTYDEAQTICPSGWRLPNYREVDLIRSKLIDTIGSAYLKDGSGGRCYFPYSGSSKHPEYDFGYYWVAKEPLEKKQMQWSLTLMRNKFYISRESNAISYSVRCVKTVSDTLTYAHSVSVRVGNIIIADRNVGVNVPQGGIALNYTNEKEHPDHKNILFKGGMYTWKQALKICPKDWRLPTIDELEIIGYRMDAGAKIGTFIDGDCGGRCFFPLSGSGQSSLDEGNYWSSSYDPADQFGRVMADCMRIRSGNKGFGKIWLHDTWVGEMSVRCVKTVE